LLKEVIPAKAKVNSVSALINQSELKFRQKNNGIEIVLPENLDEVVSVYKIELK